MKNITSKKSIHRQTCTFILVYGQGFQLLGSKVDYTIRSSPSNPVPTSFTGSNPIHIQLENDPSGNKKYVDISLSKQVVLSGLNIQTIEKMALGSFTISYLDRSIEYPGSMKTFTRLQNNDQQVIQMNAG